GAVDRHDGAIVARQPHEALVANILDPDDLTVGEPVTGGNGTVHRETDDQFPPDVRMLERLDAEPDVDLLSGDQFSHARARLADERDADIALPADHRTQEKREEAGGQRRRRGTRP